MASPSSPKSETQTQLAPTTLRGSPSLSILQRPAHSPGCLLSLTSMRGTFFSRARPCTNFLYVGSLQDSAKNTTCAFPASMYLATSCKPRMQPSATIAFFKTLRMAVGKSLHSSSTSTAAGASSASISDIAAIDAGLSSAQEGQL